MKSYKAPSIQIYDLYEKDVMFASGEYIGTDPGFGSGQEGGIF